MNETAKTQGPASSIGNTTLYNLQHKRTLPRDVLKWMQGLDLSYSVKDYRKDLSNGYLIGEIVSRYEPGRIPMHAFQNSQNQERRNNNWNLLALFFSKNELRKVKIEEAEYSKIKSDNDPKSEQLHEFICRLYSVCTKRNLPEPGQTVELPATQSRNPNLTASYLLKDDGLEKLDNSRVSNTSNIEPDKVNEDRVPTRKIQPNVDSPARVDVKGIGIKQEANRKMTSKRKSWEMKSESYYEDANPYVEKYVFDYLNEIVEECLAHEDSASNEVRAVFQNRQQKPTQVLIKHLPLETKFLLQIFQGVKASVNEILNVMLKDLNQVWKFFNYFIRMLSYFPDGSEQLQSLLELLTIYAIGSNSNEKKKINKVFTQSLVDSLIGEVRACTDWRKKERIISLTYDFGGRQVEDKKAVLFTLKQKLGSNSPLYFLWLSVLVAEQKPAGNSKLVQDFIYYAHQQLGSPNPSLRTGALKILSTVAGNGWIGLLETFLAQEATMRRFRHVTDFEACYLASSVYFALLRHIVEGNEYQTLAKGRNQGNVNALKVYNPDHERQTAEIKQKVHNIAMTISCLYHNTTSQSTRELIAKQSLALMSQCTPLMVVVVYHLGSLADLGDFTKPEPAVHELKSCLARCQPVDPGLLNENTNEMISEMVRLHIDKQTANIPENADVNLPIKQQLPFLNFCMENLNVKKLNTQLWDTIGDKLCKYVAALLAQERYSAIAWAFLARVYEIVFNYDMKMHNLNGWVGDSLTRLPQAHPVWAKVYQFFQQHFSASGLDQIRGSVEEINQFLERAGKDSQKIPLRDR